MNHTLAILSTKKTVLLFGLFSAFMGSEAVDPTMTGADKWLTYGIGGTLAALMFYFYRQLAAQSIERERANADAYKSANDRLMTVLDNNTKVMTTLCVTVDGVNETVENVNREQRDRYENDLRTKGRILPT